MVRWWKNSVTVAQSLSSCRSAVTCALFFQALFFSYFASAAIPPAGTPVSNTAQAQYTKSGQPLNAASNSVLATVAGLPIPALTKAFGALGIANGAATPLVFTINNASGLPAQAGIAFTDTLPAGLRLMAGATVTISGAGCNGVAQTGGNSIISVNGLSMLAGTATCTITVSGVTNQLGQLNPSCAAPPAAFTNGPSSISGLANVLNLVSNQCLVVGNAGVANGQLLANQQLTVAPGATVYFPHRLINGALADTYNLTINNLAGAYNLANVVILPDNNGDGVPDSMQPLILPIALGANQTFRFVVSAAVPVNAQTGQSDSLSVRAASIIAGRPPLPAVTDTATIFVQPPVEPYTGIEVQKIIRPLQGGVPNGPLPSLSPDGPFEVAISYWNASVGSATKTQVRFSDMLPAGLQYIPGSGRWSETGATVLSDEVAGADIQSVASHAIKYDFNVSSANTVTAEVATIAPGEVGQITFQVMVTSGIAIGTVIDNIASYSYFDSTAKEVGPNFTGKASVTIVGSQGVSLVGETIAAANPSSEVIFTNTLTNQSAQTDTFDITLTGSTFPAGTVLKLFKADGVSPLVDTNGNGIPDTGPVAPGANYKIVLKATLPAAIIGGPFKVTKNAKSGVNFLIAAKGDDVVSTVNKQCRVVYEPDNSGAVAAGGSIVYSHLLSNLGNCQETVTFPADFFANTAPDWVAEIYIDNHIAGGASIVSVVDATDLRVMPGASLPLIPGSHVTVLIRVVAPETAKVGDVNTTSSNVMTSNSGLLTVKDVTRIDAADARIDNALQAYLDSAFTTPTRFAYIGTNLYFKATGPSCNLLPDMIENRIILITGANGEQEELVAIETGSNTGIFVTSGVLVHRPPIVAGNGRLEGNPLDTFDAEVIGCGRKIMTTITLIDPNGVVFDSRTNQPVAGATVTLLVAVNDQCTNSPAMVSKLVDGKIVPASSVFVTGADGRFDFPLVAAGDFCARVTPPNGYTWASKVPVNKLPPGRTILATGPTSGGSYGGAFRVGPETGPVILDIPVDSGNMSGLFVQKTVLRAVVEIGDFIDYTVTIRNNTGTALDIADVLVADALPAGFTYVAGSARLDGKPLADPAGKAGPQLVFNIGKLAKDQEVKLTYRVRVGAGAMQGDGINRVIATYHPPGGGGSFSDSNVGAVKVEVTGGVFSDKAFIVGKVYADCNKNRIQDETEVGVPGVRLILEDGTAVITDAEGKFSLYGLSARLHVLKIDRTTLPPGAKMLALSNRNMGKGDSRFIDLKFGELHKTDFAIEGCTEPVMLDVRQRRAATANMQTEIEARLLQRLEVDAALVRNVGDVKGLPASGVVGQMVTTNPSTGERITTPSALPVERPTGFSTLAPLQADANTRPLIRAAAAKQPVIPLEQMLLGLDNSFGFIGLKNGDTLPYTQTNIRIKGLAGATFKLIVNAQEIVEKRVGKRSVYAEKKVQAWEYIGIDLKAGENEIVALQLDPFGNERAKQSIKIIAPGGFGKILLEFPNLPKAGAIADGRTAVKMVIKITDNQGVPVTARTPVTLSTDVGRLSTADLNPLESGVQVFIEGGYAEYFVEPPQEPGAATVTVESGVIKTTARIDFLPNLREMLAAGLIEGVLSLRNLNTRALVPARAQDGFEQELQHFARTSSDGKQDVGLRAALFLKGKIKGEYLLTLAYDSEKDTRERLFRDIQPDAFYPVYGDSSTRTFDAQSTARFYLRVDHGKSYLLYGDYNTSQPIDARKLSNYNRSLTGIRQHFETQNVVANVFASRDTSRQIVQEIAANGTSGPFTLSNASGLINSEKIEVLTRDRNQPSVILKAVPLTRFFDYEIEPLTGRILLKAPIPSLDENLHPLSLRITYEIDQGGDPFWVVGGDIQAKLTDRIEVGANYVQDHNPLDKFRMTGINAIAKLADKTLLIAEVAHTSRDTPAEGSRSGSAQRIELKHQGESFDAALHAARSDMGFENQSANMGKGRTELGGKLAYRIDDKNRVIAEVLRTEENVSKTLREGYMLSAEHTFENRMRLEAGLRHARDTQPVPIAGAAKVPTEVTSVRTRLTGPIPGLEKATAYGEVEVDIHDPSRKIVALGGDYELPNKGRLYARYEFISSLTGPYGLDSQQRQNTTVFGVNTEYMKDGNLFSEYRVRDAISGGDTEAALGLRNTWTLMEGVRLQTGFERVHALSGTGQAESTAATFGLEYTANPLWKGSTRLELRKGTNTDSILSTVGVASKLNRDWTLLGRNTYSIIKNKAQSVGESEQNRMQLGVAYRDTETDKWNALARIEHRSEKDTTQPDVKLKRTVELLSIHANWQPRRPFTFGGRYAAKWTNENSNDITSKYSAQLAAARATWEFAPRWDLSINASTLLSNGMRSKQYGTGVELGFMVMENLWLSAGYNFFGYREEDLAAGNYTNKGAYLRLRYKFDEEIWATQPVTPTGDAQPAKVPGK